MTAARLLDVNDAASYLGVSPWTLRGLVADGVLVPVRIPSARVAGASRRLLFDRQDLDRLVEEWKSTSTATPNAGLSEAAVKGWTVRTARRKKAAPRRDDVVA